MTFTYLRRVVVHVVDPTVPGRINFLSLKREPLAVVSVLNEAPLVLVFAVKAFIKTIAIAVGADKWSQLVTETGLFVC